MYILGINVDITIAHTPIFYTILNLVNLVKNHKRSSSSVSI